MRQFLSIVVPLVLPTILYFLYAVMARRARAAGTGRWQEVPWTWLAVAGIMLVAVSLGAIALFGGADPGSTYQPAKMIDGKIQPGGFVE